MVTTPGEKNKDAVKGAQKKGAQKEKKDAVKDAPGEKEEAKVKDARNLHRVCRGFWLAVKAAKIELTLKKNLTLGELQTLSADFPQAIAVKMKNGVYINTQTFGELLVIFPNLQRIRLQVQIQRQRSDQRFLCSFAVRYISFSFLL